MVWAHTVHVLMTLNDHFKNVSQQSSSAAHSSPSGTLLGICASAPEFQFCWQVSDLTMGTLAEDSAWDGTLRFVTVYKRRKATWSHRIRLLSSPRQPPPRPAAGEAAQSVPEAGVGAALHSSPSVSGARAETGNLCKAHGAHLHPPEPSTAPTKSRHLCYLLK